MQTDVGGAPDTVTASFLYAARYGYSDIVIHNDNQLRVFPREGEGQFACEWELWSLPAGRGVEYQDRFGNRVRRLRVVEPHTVFVVAAAGRVRLSTGFPAGAAAPEDDVRIGALEGLPESFEYTAISPLVDPAAFIGLAAGIADGDGALLEAVNGVIRWVYDNIAYRRGGTSINTTAEDVLAAGGGVCQDKTHLALGLLRALKIPCRYVSGLLTGQTGETHSWAEFYHPRHGWLGADPTKGVILPQASDYVKLGVGRDYTDVSPVTGSFLSKGEARDIAAIAAVSLPVDAGGAASLDPGAGGEGATLEAALELLSRAYVVPTETGGANASLERPEGSDD